MRNGEYRIEGWKDSYSIRNYKDGEFHGLSTFFVKNSRGKYVKEREEDYYNGEICGMIVVYRQNGDAWKITDYAGGKKYGRHIEYHSTGFAKTIGHHRDGKKDGKWINYDKTGEIKTKECFYNKKGKMEGLCIVRDMKGNLKKRCSYDSGGKLHGEVIEYHDPAKKILHYEWNYEGGYKVGLQKTYNTKGSLEIEETYKIVDAKTKRRLENIFYCGRSNPHGVHKHYDENGKLMHKGHYDNGVRCGLWLFNLCHAEYHQNGEVYPLLDLDSSHNSNKLKSMNATMYDAWKNSDLTLFKQLCKINRYKLFEDKYLLEV